MVQLLLCLLVAAAPEPPGMPSLPSGWRAGLLAVDAATGEELLSASADETFRPASSVKLVTTLLALEELGPAWRWETALLADTAAGRLWLVGEGAPLLSAEHLSVMAMETAATLPPGESWELLWDVSRFLPESHCLGWDRADWSRTYCPPVEALSIGDNVLQVVVSSVGDTLRALHYPELPGLSLSLYVERGWRTSLECDVSGWDEGPPTMEVSGTIEPGTVAILYKPFAGAPSELASMAEMELAGRGLDLAGGGPGALGDRSGLQTVSVMRSDPLFVVLASMNKWSRNMVAEMVLRSVSAERGVEPASTGAGCDLAGEMLLELLPDGGDFALADGSGLSRLNMLTPRHLAAVVRAGARSPEYGPEFLATLPVAGVDGTLASRMGNLPPGSFRGKTGTLSDTSSLAGLLRTSGGRELVVVIMLEYPSGSTWTARGWQDTVVSRLWEAY